MLRISSLLRTKGFPILNIVVTLGLLLSGTVYAASAPEGSWLRQAGTSALQETGAIAGHITKAADGTPIANALVVAHNSSTLYVSVKTAANGAYSLTGLPVATYQVTATAAGYDALTQNGAQVTENSATTVDFALQASQPVNQGGSLTGHVRAASSGDAIAGATVLLVQGASVLLGATTDTNGLYGFIGIAAAGTYSAIAFAPGYQPATQANIAIAADTTTTVNFALQLIPSGSIAGTITNASNSQPIQAAEVKAKSGATLVATVTTNASGHYSLANLATGSYSLEVSAAGFQSASQGNVAVSTNTTTTVNFALQAVVAPPSATGSLIGQVVNAANGQSVAEAVALLRQRTLLPILSALTEETVAQTTTDAAGKYSFTSLEPGIYRLRVQAESFHKVTIDNIAILSGQTAVVNVALRPKEEQQPHGTITGRVTDKATGEAVENAVVFFTPSHGQDKDGHDRRFVRTNDHGAYVLENVPAGTYEIHVNAKGYKPAKVKDVTVKGGEETTVNITLEGVPGRGRKEDNSNDDHEKSAKDNPGHGNKNQGNENGEQKGRGHGKLDGSISLQSVLTPEQSAVMADLRIFFERQD